MRKVCSCYRCRVRDAAVRDARFIALMAANGPWQDECVSEFERLVAEYGVRR